MALTIVVLSGADPAAPDPSLTLDAPRVVVGRGEGCEVRLPDTSVSHRHASLRQRGGEHVLVDEGSANGTFLGGVRLPPQTPRAVRSGDRIRVGRVWLEVRIEPAVVKGSTAAAAKELALALVSRGLRAQGEEPGPRIRVLAGRDAGRELLVAEAGRPYVIGRAAEADLALDDAGVGRRQVTVVRRGDALAVRDAGSGAPARLDGEPLGQGDATWRPGQVLVLGGAELGFAFPAIDALAEIERSPDERMAEDEQPSPPPLAAAAEEALGEGKAGEATPTPEPAAATADRAPKTRALKDGSGWGVVDSAVVLLALGVLALSVIGAFWLLGR
jgi:pSer/pThr/pTyr-binding forkhead associated (FHA) protein